MINMYVMSEEINFGFKSIAFYIGKFPALNVIDPQEIPPSEDSQGGYLFMYDHDRYFIHLNNLDEFEVIVLHDNNDLAMILLPDAEDLLAFFGNLVGGGKIYL
tara:strand:+ start:202 stop:510 length:309 start_codon:yes stop_codon:yes gene_type:complete